MDGTAGEKRDTAGRRAVFLVLSAVLLALWGYHSCFLKPLVDRRDTLTAEYTALEARIAARQRLAVEMDRCRERGENMKEAFARAARKTPAGDDVPGLMKAFSEAGERAGLEILLFEPLPPASRECYAEIPVRVSLKGSYGAIRELFQMVARMPRLVTISEFTVTRSPGGGLAADCLVTAFQLTETGNDSGKQGKEKR
ncbi:MAG TPA: type 4a pilus biogenesis protein PilO [Syntrophales bacterium]|nr:type 4a pilus biogenesis protein PilO [Syntrophales bacterium]